MRLQSRHLHVVHRSEVVHEPLAMRGHWCHQWWDFQVLHRNLTHPSLDSLAVPADSMQLESRLSVAGDGACNCPEACWRLNPAPTAHDP